MAASCLSSGEFPGCPVVRTQAFTVVAWGSHLSSEGGCPPATQVALVASEDLKKKKATRKKKPHFWGFLGSLVVRTLWFHC